MCRKCAPLCKEYGLNGKKGEYEEWAEEYENKATEVSSELAHLGLNSEKSEKSKLPEKNIYGVSEPENKFFRNSRFRGHCFMLKNAIKIFGRKFRLLIFSWN